MAIKSSTVVVDKTDKINRMKGKVAVELARKANDPLAKKAAKARMLYTKYLDLIQAKYGQKAAAVVRGRMN